MLSQPKDSIDVILLEARMSGARNLALGKRALMADFISHGLGVIRGIFSSNVDATPPTARRLLLGDMGDLQNGQMKEIPLVLDGRNFKVLLSRIEDQYYATSHLCPHYKARLVTGTLGKGGRLVCPWHAACFNVRTGNIEEAPSLEALKTYPVTIEESKIFLNVHDAAGTWERGSP